MGTYQRPTARIASLGNSSLIQQNTPRPHMKNRLRFGQAHGTFPIIPPFSESVDWAASTLSAEAILELPLQFEDENLDEAST
jgi:hypothetical protein